MADQVVDFPDHEYNVFKICQSFKPPFYVRTLGGIYDTEEDSSYSAGQVYAVLHKLKIRSVIATVRGNSLKIPLDYDGQFCIVGQPQNGSLTMREIMEIVTPQNLPQEVRLSSSTQKHGKHFLEMLDNIGRGTRTCNLTISREITDEYFIGKSPDGKLMMLFSTEATLSFQAKKAAIHNVQHLHFNMNELKYDIFVAKANIPAVNFFCTEEAVYTRPRRPPKPKPSPDNKSSVAGKSPIPQGSSLDDSRNGVSHYEIFHFTPPQVAGKPAVKPKLPLKQSQRDRQYTPPSSPYSPPPSPLTTKDQSQSVPSTGDTRPKPLVTPKPTRAKWEQPQNHSDIEPSNIGTKSSDPFEAGSSTPTPLSSKFPDESKEASSVNNLTKLSGMSEEPPRVPVRSVSETQKTFKQSRRKSSKDRSFDDKEFVTQTFQRGMFYHYQCQ